MQASNNVTDKTRPPVAPQHPITDSPKSRAPNDESNPQARHDPWSPGWWDSIKYLNSLNAALTPEWLKTLELWLFNTLTGFAVGVGVATGCAATALLGCASITAAGALLTISLQGAMDAAAHGKDPFQGAIDALHDPTKWVTALFDGGVGGYFKFKFW